MYSHEYFFVDIANVVMCIPHCNNKLQESIKQRLAPLVPEVVQEMVAKRHTMSLNIELFVFLPV